MDLFLSILLGALVGLRNEIVFVKKGKGPLGGFRSYIFIAVLGYLSGVLALSALGGVLSFVLHLAIVGIVLVYYFFDLRRREGKLGLTMELSALIVYVATFAIATNVLPDKIAVAIVILIAFLLASQKGLRHLLFSFKEEEVTQIALFATLTFVVLPFLPNTYYSIADLSGMFPELRVLLAGASGITYKIVHLGLINPFKLWMFVVLVSGIEILGYLISRLVGRTTSIVLTSLVSGFISSTSSTIAFSREAKESNDKLIYLAAILLANAISFVEVYLLVLPVSLKYFSIIFWPNTWLLIILGILGVLVLVFGQTRKYFSNSEETSHASKMFDFKFAISFAMLLTIVQIVTKIAYVYLGDAGFLITSALAGFSGINAVLINTGILLQNGLISPTLAVWTFIVVNVVNLFAKSVYILLNKQKEISLWYTVSVILALAASIFSAI